MSSYRAAEPDEMDLVLLLIERGADLMARDRGSAATALHYAAAKGIAVTVDLLIEHGAELDAPSKIGATPLHRSTHYQNKPDHEVVRRLLEHGADVTATDATGHTTLYRAAAHDTEEVIQLLIEYELEIDATSDSTPLQVAESQENAEAAALLPDLRARTSESALNDLLDRSGEPAATAKEVRARGIRLDDEEYTGQCPICRR